MSIGEFLSSIKNPLIKVSRILELATDLRSTLEELESIDVIKQESFSRQLSLSNKKLLNTVKTLDEEVSLNNQLTKENHSLHKRIKMLNGIVEENRMLVKNQNKKINRLKKYRDDTKKKFEKWLKIRLLKKEKNKKISIEKVGRKTK